MKIASTAEVKTKLVKTGGHVIAHFKKMLLAGLFFWAAIFVTYLIVNFSFHIVDNILKPLVSLLPVISENTTGVGTISLILLFYITGLIGNVTIGKRLLKFLTKLPYKIPVIGVVYSLVHPAIEPLQQSLTEQLTENNVGKVVGVIFDNLGESKAVGLLMRETMITKLGMHGIIISRELHAVVYFASSPNPSTGQILTIPMSEIWEVEVTFSNNDNEKPKERSMTMEGFNKAMMSGMSIGELVAAITSLGANFPKEVVFVKKYKSPLEMD